MSGRSGMITWKHLKPFLLNVAPKPPPGTLFRADKKWYRNLVISEKIVETLEGLDLKYPDPAEGLDDIVIE